MKKNMQMMYLSDLMDLEDLDKMWILMYLLHPIQIMNQIIQFINQICLVMMKAEISSLQVDHLSIKDLVQKELNFYGKKSKSGRVKLDRHDPEVKRLLNKMIDRKLKKKEYCKELKAKRKGKLNKNKTKTRRTVNYKKLKQMDPTGEIPKSPSDTMLYTPALKKNVDGGAMIRGVVDKHINNDKEFSPFQVSQISQFVEQIRRENRAKHHGHGSGKRLRSCSRSRSRTPFTDSSDDSELEQYMLTSGEEMDKSNRAGDRKEARAQAKDYKVNSEMLKASLIPPKGKGINECIGDSGNSDSF